MTGVKEEHPRPMKTASQQSSRAHPNAFLSAKIHRLTPLFFHCFRLTPFRSAPTNAPKASASGARVLLSILAVAVIAIMLPASAHASARTWKNTAGNTDFNAGGSYTGGIAPGLGDVALFSGAAVAQPNLSASVSIAGLLFTGTSTSGYDLTNNANAVLTLTGYNATGAANETSNSSAAAIRAENTSGSNTIDAPLTLTPAGTPSGFSVPTSIFYQASGGTLIVNGTISGSSPLSLKGAGTIQLNAANTSLTAGVSIDQASTTLVIGNNNALGSGTLSINASSTVQAGGASRSISNSVALTSGTFTVGGTNDLTFAGTVTNAGPASRTITVNNSGNTTISGGLFLAGDDVTARTVTINGSGTITVSGVIANNNAGNTAASSLTYGGSSTLTLTKANTYSGGTTVGGGGTLLANNSTGSATGSGTVAVSNGGTLGGTGAINAGTNNVTIGTTATSGGSATITGGTNGTVGALTLTVNSLTFSGSTNNLSTYLVDLTSTASDKLIITGNLDLSTLSDQIKFQGTTGAASYQLATYTGTLSGAFDTVTGLPSGYSLVYNPGEIDLNMSPVPEPSTWAAGILAVAAVAYSQRRRFVRQLDAKS